MAPSGYRRGAVEKYLGFIPTTVLGFFPVRGRKTDDVLTIVPLVLPVTGHEILNNSGPFLLYCPIVLLFLIYSIIKYNIG